MWPLLDSNQDPDSLEARVAYHLYRLDIKGARLARMLQRSNETATRLTAAEVDLTEQNVAELASVIHVDVEDLTLPITEAEHIEWHFYRVSAHYPREVWDAAHASWRVRGCTVTEAANIMQLSRGYVSKSSSPATERPTPLTYPPAFLLSTALSLPLGTDHFLPIEHRFHLQSSARHTR